MAFLLEWIPAACQAGIGRKILRGRCSEAAPGRKRYHFRRGTGYQPPAGQENASIPARKVLRGGSGQKKASFPARNWIPTACRAEKHLNSCAEGASESFGAEKGVISCAEWDTDRLPPATNHLPPAVTFPVYCKNPGSGTPKDKDNHLVCKNCRYFLFLRPKNKERRQRVIEVLVGRGCGT